MVTTRPAETIVKEGGTSYVFVTEGIEDALARARDAAGVQDIRINGGADSARQYLYAGAVQELHLHLVPVVLGGGTRLFDGGLPPGIKLQPLTATSTPSATHLTYEVTATMPV